MIDECYLGDVRDGLLAFAEAGIRPQTCVTSPPYWGLRDYGVDGQIGLEPTIAEYVAGMVDVFRLVRDVLADDGTLWLNLGDSYCASPNGNLQGDFSTSSLTNPARQSRLHSRRVKDLDSKQASNTTADFAAPHRGKFSGLKPKDLCGIPWRVAFALQADGWYLRQDIIWSKPNPMPESVTDRCTKAHEYIFLLSKRERYYYDQKAILEPVSVNTHARLSQDVQGQIGSDRVPGKTNGNMKAVGRKLAEPGSGIKNNGSFDAAMAIMPTERNKRSVWTVTTQPYADAHFATFPPALIEPCILAGSRPGDVVLDPFMGSGTVAQVAQSLGRKWIGCELNPDYHAMIRRRSAQRGMEFVAWSAGCS